MHTVAIIQARMASTRLPGKVLADVNGRPMLARVIERVRHCKEVNEICIATTTSAGDEAIVALARSEDVRCCRGSESDVLERYVTAAHDSKADVIVRLTADCPLIDPDTTDAVIRELTLHAGQCDYASNVQPRSFPRGLDTEAFFLDTLLRINRLAASKAAREHVTVYARSEHPELFLMRNVRDAADNSDLRWTVDEPADLEMARTLHTKLEMGRRLVRYPEILAFVRAHPLLARLNSGVETWDPR